MNKNSLLLITKLSFVFRAKNMIIITSNINYASL